MLGQRRASAPSARTQATFALDPAGEVLSEALGVSDAFESVLLFACCFADDSSLLAVLGDVLG